MIIIAIGSLLALTGLFDIVWNLVKPAGDTQAMSDSAAGLMLGIAAVIVGIFIAGVGVLL